MKVQAIAQQNGSNEGKDPYRTLKMTWNNILEHSHIFY